MAAWLDARRAPVRFRPGRPSFESVQNHLGSQIEYDLIASTGDFALYRSDNDPRTFEYHRRAAEARAMTAPDRIPIASGVVAVATSRGVEVRRQVSGDTEEIVAIVEWGAVEVLRAKRPANYMAQR